LGKDEYLSVAEALRTVLDAVHILPPVSENLINGLHRVLSEPIVAQHDLPPFANSSMDGFAIRAEDVSQASKDSPIRLKVIADIAAGQNPEEVIKTGSAARITTGAPMPRGADAVIPVEDTDENWRDRSRPLPDSIQIYRSVDLGAYVRLAGEDIKAGDHVLSPGTVLRPQELGLIASLGYKEVSVIRQPKVGILATGDELVDVAQPLGPGQIRNSNSYTQAAQVLAAGAEPVILGVAKDSEESVRERLQLAIDKGVSLIISSAGVSVGAFDVVKSVLEADGRVLFWRFRMRPGKPLTFGSYQGVPYLGLPGNPVSAMVSFDRFARPAILKMSGYKQLERRTVSVVIEDEIQSDGRESYLRAVVTRESGVYRASIFGGQGSHMLSSLVGANALVIVPENVEYVGTGSLLEAIMIDWPETVF